MGNEFYSLVALLLRSDTQNLTREQRAAFCQLIEAIEGEENQ